MSDEKVLTKEIAEQFLADDESVDLSEFTAIEDAAAESLSEYEDGLGLSGLTELSDAAAESLGKHEGDLWLDGLWQLSDAAAESFGKYKGGTCRRVRWGRNWARSWEPRLARPTNVSSWVRIIAGY